MRLAKHVENENTWQRNAEVEAHRHQDTGAPRALGKVQGKGSGRGKGKSKKRTLETCLCCGKKGHKKADCKFKTATRSNCGKVGHLRAVCRNMITHEIEKDADEPTPKVTVEAVWCMAVRDTVDGEQCGGMDKHGVSSEHGDL